MSSISGRKLCQHGILSWATDRGRRPFMEDHCSHKTDASHLSGFVFDGHGNTSIPFHLDEIFQRKSVDMSMLSSSEIVQLWRDINDWVKQYHDGGSTCSGFTWREGEWRVLNSGDSRTYIIDSVSETIIFKTQDHKPDSEVDRISAMGGLVMNGRIGGTLGVSRGFGDKWHVGVIPDPDITMLYDGDLAVSVSDGVTGALCDEEILSVVLSSDHGDSANALISHAKMKGVEDNVVAVVGELGLKR